MKKFLVTLIACLAISSVAMAAPMTNLNKGDTTAGYLYWNPKITVDVDGRSYDAEKANANGVYVETAINDNWIVGIETIKGSKDKTISGVNCSVDSRFTDVTVQYKIDNNFRLIAGNRNYDTSLSATGIGSADESTNKFTYGIGVSTAMGDKTTAYTTLLHNDIATDWQIGVNQDLSKNVFLNVNYRCYDEDNITLKGVGAGLSYKF